MARNKKVEILSNDKEVLHPMTDGDCVIFEDGQTLTQKLSEDDSVKYTPEIVNSSPMFKVGEGNTVDYSDNVLDGAYERATLQGQTYVNYIQESSADEVTLPTPFTEYERTQHNTLTSDEEGTLGINLVGQSYVNALQHDSEEEFVVLGESLEFQEKKVEYTNEGQIKSAMLKGQTLVNLLDFDNMINSNTTYVKDGDTLIVKGVADGVWANTSMAPNYPLHYNKEYILMWDSVAYNHTDSYGVQQVIGIYSTRLDNDDQVAIKYTEDINQKYLIFRVPENSSNEFVRIRIHSSTYTSEISTTTVKGLKLLEYQEGMENWDIPYFEGMQSVTVSTRLENLCHKHTTSSLAKTGKTFKSTGSINDRVIQLINLQDGSASSIYGMKPSTKYLVQFKISNLVLDGLSSLAMQFSTSTVDNGNSVFVNGTVKKLINSNGIYRVVLTTSDILETSNIEIKGVAEQWENSGSSLRSMTISEIMYVEYQNGMENWDLPYFEDYQVMKPVQVESASKNEFNTKNANRVYGCTPTFHSDNSFTLVGLDDRAYKSVGFLVDVKPNTNYRLSYSCERISGATNAFYDVYSADDKYITHDGQLINTGNNTRLSIRFYINGDNTNNGTIKYYDIQLEQNTTATSFVPHQSKTTYSWDEVILRKIGDVEDTLDLTTGEWVQRIGEIVLNGSENWATNNESTTQTIRFILKDTPMDSGVLGQDYSTTINQYECDKLQKVAWNETTPLGITHTEHIIFIYNNSIENSAESIKQWLKSNPIKIQYILETPKRHKVNLSRPNLQVYDDITHVHTKCLDGTLIPNIYLPSDVSYPAILEPGKKYNVCVNHTEVSADNPLKVNVGGTEITMTDSRMTLTTPATLANSNVSFTGKGNKIKESMLIKNSSLLTRDLPHFNGIGSVQLGKTIENLCSASGFKAGNSNATITWNDNYAHTKISTKVGSCVFVYELVKPLKNGKKYFVYSPQTLGNDSCRTSFRQVYNNNLTYSKQQTLLPKNGKCIIEIDQYDNPYTHICVGCHHDIPLNTEFDVYRPIICAYEPGMEDWDWESIGYFTGTKNIGNEFMRVQNKNLLTEKLVPCAVNHYLLFPWYYIYHEDAITTRNRAVSGYYKMKPGATYTVSTNHTDTNIKLAFHVGNSNTTIQYDTKWYRTISYTNTNNYEYIYVYVGRDDRNWTGREELDNIFNTILFEESSTATTYTAHKHNGLYITKDQPIELTWEQGQVLVADFGDTYTSAINNTLSTRVRNKGLLNLKPNTTYRVSLGNKAGYKYHIACFDNQDFAEHAITGIATGWVSSTDTIFTTTKDMHKIGINVAKIGDTNITPGNSVHAQVRLEEVTDVVLRSCSGKYDELDLTRGTYTQNVGVVYVDGVNQHSNYITVVGDSYQPADTTLKTFDIRCDGAVVDSICLSNRFPMRESMTSTDINFESVRIHSTNSSCRLTIKKEKASTLEEFKLWLQDNPLEIVYALSKPIVHKVHIGNKNEAGTEVAKPNDVFTLPTLYTEQTHIDLTNNSIMPKVQSRDYIAYPVLPMVSRTYTLQHNLTGGVSNLTVDLLGRTQAITYQNHKSLVYTPETMAILHHELRISGKGKISKVMYIDGGYMDRDIPYIEGMKNAVNPIVRNIGKNLYNKDNVYIFNDGEYIGTRDYYKKSTFKVKRNTNYVMTFEQKSNDARIYGFSDETFITYLGANTGGASWVTFNTGTCNGISFYRQVKSGLTIDYKITLSEIGTDEPYKENICYVDCGEIRLTPDMFEQGSIYSVQAHIGLHYNDDKTNATTRLRTKNLIKVEPNETYVFMPRNNDYVYSMHFYDKNGIKVGVASPYDLSWKGTTPFTIPSNCETGAIFIAKQQHTNITLDNIDAFDCSLIKVSEIKQLRSLPHGVQDEIDLETGKYIQRVGEITFNGTENWTVGYPSWENKLTYYNYDFIDIKTFKGDNGSGQAYYDAVRCPQLHRSYMSRLASALIDGVCSYYYSGYQRIFISKQDCATVDELKLWLKENPITVQYELPEPIVKDIVIHNYPHSYENGHVIIENGDPSTPIPAQLTYRAVTNRSGQIQQHTEQVEKQEREINELETLILANIHLSQTR